MGGTGTVVDLSVYKLLLMALVPKAGAALALSRGLAIWVAMTWNFFLNRRLTFSHSRSDKALPQYGRFVLACSLGALVNWSIGVSLPLKAAFFDSHRMYAAAVGILVGLVFNYALSRYWAFRRLAHSAPHSTKPPEN